jgi:hypothetical protein
MPDGTAARTETPHPRRRVIEYESRPAWGRGWRERPPVTTRERFDPLSKLSETLGEHYRTKQAFYALKPPKTYDRDLSRLFSADPWYRRAQPAAVFIRRHHAWVKPLVARWTGENQLTLDAVLDDMIARCRELDRRAPGSERKLVINFTILLMAKTMHALFGPSRRKSIARTCPLFGWSQS